MFNNAATITRCLDSVLSQDGVDYEVLVVDDDSTDGGVDVVARALRPGDRLIRNDTRLGLVGNHNECLEQARGRYVQFVHADDWLLPGALQALAGELEQARGGLAFSPRQVVTEDKTFLRKCGQLHTHFRKLRERNDGKALAMQVVVNGIHHNWVGEPTCVMFRRQLALDAGRFRDDVYQMLDLDLWLRLMIRSTVCFVPRELSARCHTTATESVRNKAIRRDWLDQLRVLASMSVDPAAPSRIRMISRLWWFLIWPRVVVEGVALGPNRYAHLKESVTAPFSEFARARAILARGGDVQPSTKYEGALR
ncbi:glycosyltransferase [Mycolicibacterium sp. P1-18]|nr:glycosyltransferase [Mycolicibacterium sp. P1-18]